MGVNIINADNGMGKSKIYNGILWLLCNQLYDSDKRIKVNVTDAPLKMLSDKAKIESESIESGVRIIFEDDYYTYKVSKSVNFTKKKLYASTSTPGDWDINNPKVDVEKISKTKGNTLPIYDIAEQNEIINRIISPALQSYALLQGEAIDDIVDLSDSSMLSKTIETLTDLDELKTINSTTSSFVRLADRELSAKRRLSKSNRTELDDLENKKNDQEKIIRESEESIEISKRELGKAKTEKQNLYAQISNTEKRVQFQSAIKQIDADLDRLYTERDALLSGITNRLFNRSSLWVILASGGVIANFSVKRDEYILRQRENRILSNPESFFSKLPEGSPDAVSLSKMITEHKCFVCGTHAPEGSKELEHILKVRDHTSAKKSQKVDKPTLKSFFDEIQLNTQSYNANFIDGIFGDVGGVRKEIRKLDDAIDDLKKKKSEAELELFNYGGDMSASGVKKDTDIINAFDKATSLIQQNEQRIKSATEAAENAKRSLTTINANIKSACKDIDTSELECLRDIIGDVDIIFTNTKERIYDKVISNLEIKTNEYYSQLTIGNNVLGGQIKFERTSHDSIEIEVFNASGATLSGASEGYQRMKKIAVVMAIISSKIGGSKFEYPFIADAPFSAFGKNFRTNFFNVTPSVFGQSIILIKDLYDPDSRIGNCLTDEGEEVLQRMKNGELKGSFYINTITDKADTTGLVTSIKKYY